MSKTSSSTQQVQLEESEGDKKRKERRAKEIQNTVTAAESHKGEPVADLALQNATLLDFAHGDINTANKNIGILVESVDGMSTGLHDLTSAVKSNGKRATIPIPIGGKTHQFPARYAIAILAMFLVFVFALASTGHLKDFVGVWKEVRAIKAGTAALEMPKQELTKVAGLTNDTTSP